MNQQNLVVIEGNAVRDAELKRSNNGTSICKMSIANNRFYKSGDGFEKEVSFFDIDAFGEVAKLCGDKVKKGDDIRVTGRMKQSRWQQDGQNRTAVVVVAERVEFGSKTKNGASASDTASAVDGIDF